MIFHLSVLPDLQSGSYCYKYCNAKKHDVGNKIYENNTLKRILIDGGYYESGNYYFYITDHLGNNRVVAAANGTIVQSTQYYPFGASFADASGTSTQPYLYNNKIILERYLIVIRQ